MGRKKRKKKKIQEIKIVGGLRGGKTVNLKV